MSEVVKRATKQTALVQAYKNVFGTTEGKQVLFDLMKKHGILTEDFNGDVNLALTKIGERRVVLGILSKLNYDVTKMKERIEEYVRDQE